MYGHKRSALFPGSSKRNSRWIVCLGMKFQGKTVMHYMNESICPFHSQKKKIARLDSSDENSNYSPEYSLCT